MERGGKWAQSTVSAGAGADQVRRGVGRVFSGLTIPAGLRAHTTDGGRCTLRGKR